MEVEKSKFCNEGWFSFHWVVDLQFLWEEEEEAGQVWVQEAEQSNFDLKLETGFHERNHKLGTSGNREGEEERGPLVERFKHGMLFSGGSHFKHDPQIVAP